MIMKHLHFTSYAWLRIAFVAIVLAHLSDASPPSDGHMNALTDALNMVANSPDNPRVAQVLAQRASRDAHASSTSTLHEIRLSDGSATRGRLELLHNGQWSTVCDDDFGSSDGAVACRQLGLGSYVGTYDASGGSGSILYDDLACSGSESSLYDCSKRSGSSDCGHDEDIGLECRDAVPEESSWGSANVNDYWGDVYGDCFDDCTDTISACLADSYASDEYEEMGPEYGNYEEMITSMFANCMGGSCVSTFVKCIGQNAGGSEGGSAAMSTTALNDVTSSSTYGFMSQYSPDLVSGCKIEDPFVDVAGSLKRKILVPNINRNPVINGPIFMKTAISEDKECFQALCSTAFAEKTMLSRTPWCSTFYNARGEVAYIIVSALVALSVGLVLMLMLWISKKDLTAAPKITRKDLWHLFLFSCRIFDIFTDFGIVAFTAHRPDFPVTVRMSDLDVESYVSYYEGCSQRECEYGYLAVTVKDISMFSAIAGVLLFIPEVFVFGRKFGLANQLGGCFAWYKPTTTGAFLIVLLSWTMESLPQFACSYIIIEEYGLKVGYAFVALPIISAIFTCFTIFVDLIFLWKLAVAKNWTIPERFFDIMCTCWPWACLYKRCDTGSFPTVREYMHPGDSDNRCTVIDCACFCYKNECSEYLEKECYVDDLFNDNIAANNNAAHPGAGDVKDWCFNSCCVCSGAHAPPDHNEDVFNVANGNTTAQAANSKVASPTPAQGGPKRNAQNTSINAKNLTLGLPNASASNSSTRGTSIANTEARTPPTYPIVPGYSPRVARKSLGLKNASALIGATRTKLDVDKPRSSSTAPSAKNRDANTYTNAFDDVIVANYHLATASTTMPRASRTEAAVITTTPRGTITAPSAEFRDADAFDDVPVANYHLATASSNAAQTPKDVGKETANYFFASASGPPRQTRDV